MSNNTTNLFGGGDILPINSMIPINSTETHLIAPDLTEWLQTGTIIEDTNGDYPDATISTNTEEGYDYIGLITESSKYGIPEYIRIK